MRERPLGKGVGREALMHERERRHEARVLQILVVLADLVGEQQPLVDHRAAAHARHVVLAAVRELERLDRARRGLADDVELALERVGHDHVGAAADEDLPDAPAPWRAPPATSASRGRPARRASRARPGPRRAPRARAPARTPGARRAPSAGTPCRRRTRPAPAATTPCIGHLGAVEVVGNLDQDAGAVAHQRVGADGAAMVEVLEDLQALLDDRVRLAARDVGDEADAAGVVLVRRARTGPAAPRHVHFCLRRHAPRVSVSPTACPDSAIEDEEYRSAAIPPLPRAAQRCGPRPARRGRSATNCTSTVIWLLTGVPPPSRARSGPSRMRRPQPARTRRAAASGRRRRRRHGLCR